MEERTKRMLVQTDRPGCFDDDLLCRWTYEVTGRVWLAESSDLVVAPVRIALIVMIALIARWMVHRTIDRMVRRHVVGGTPAVLRPLPERLRQTVQEVTSLPPERRKQRVEAIGSVLRGASTVSLFAVVVLLALSELRINLAPLLAGAGIVGVALGFGAQSLVRDVLAGLFILLEDQYGVGDLIDVGEASGTVQAVGLRVTTLRDLQGVVWYVPNGEIRRVGNRSHDPATVIVEMPIGFAPLTEATAALHRGAQRLADDAEWGPRLVEQPAIVGVERVTVEGAVIRTVVKTRADDQWQVARELRRRQVEAMAEAGVAAHILAARAYPHANRTD
jgi:moderate conductance mechanosensitive channel